MTNTQVFDMEMPPQQPKRARLRNRGTESNLVGEAIMIPDL
jgi:hypothetical protein